MKRAPPKLGQRKKTSPTKKKSPPKPKAEPKAEPEAVNDVPLPTKGAYGFGNLSIRNQIIHDLNS